MLRDLDLLDLLADGGAVAGAVLADNTDFLGALRLGWMDEHASAGRYHWGVSRDSPTPAIQKVYLPMPCLAPL